MKRVTINYGDGRLAIKETENPEEWLALGNSVSRWGEEGSFTVTIEDISEEFQLREAIASRKAEYPTAEEFLNAYFDGGQEAINELQTKRLAIKAKYPKP